MGRNHDSHWPGWCSAAGAVLVLGLLAGAASGEGVGERGGDRIGPRDFDPYMVRGIAVSATAPDAVAAKAAAIDEALRIGAARVIRRVAVGSGEGNLAAIDGDTAAELAATLEIDQERIGQTGYSADVTVSYSPMLVRGYLARMGAGVADVPASPILLVPVVVTDGTPAFWDDAAGWAAALAATDMSERLTPAVLPRNTPQDRQIRADFLLSGDRISLQELRVRYRTQGVVVARLDRTGASEAMLAGLTGEDAAGPVDVTVEVPSGGMAAAAAAVADTLSERWRAVAGGRSASGSQIGASLPVRVLFPGPDDWQALRDRLETSGAVSGLSVESVEGSAANIVIWYTGRIDDLPDRLARQGIDLFQAGGSWLLQSY